MNPIVTMFVCVILLQTIATNQHSSTYSKALKELKIDPNEPVEKLVPKMKEISREHLSDCYDATYGSITINIFNSTIHDVVQKFFEQSKELHLKGDDLKKRISIFLSNIVEMVEMIKDCTKMEKKERFPLGITSMAFYSDEEFASMQMTTFF